MVDTPATHYAKTDDDVHIAYQVFGQGPDFLYCMGLWWHLDFQWELPGMRRELERLGRFRRVILFDRRGTGLSDRVPPDALADLDRRVLDVQAVLRSAGAERPVVFGRNYACDMAIAYAVSQPSQVEALVLVDPYARLVRSADHPWGLTPEQAQRSIERVERHWDEPQGYDRMARPGDGDDFARQQWMTMQRLSVSPGAAAALWRSALDGDSRDLLPRVTVPTLVMHHAGNRMVEEGCGRYVADHIPGAQWVSLPERTAIFDDADDEILVLEEFLTGSPAAREAERTLTAVAFTDIVGSTARAVELGDQRWRSLLDEHDRIVARSLVRHGGRRVNPTGDGLLASFDRATAAIAWADELGRDLAHIGLVIRCGIHVGEVELRGTDIGGLAVHIGARIAALADAGEILVSRTVVDVIAGSGIACDDRGDHDLRGVGRWQIFAVRREESPGRS